MTNILLRANIVIIALTLSVSNLSDVHADYVAYSVKKNGQEKPLPENVDSIKAKDILNVRWGDYSGNKARVGVLEVENNSSVATVQIAGPGGQVIAYNAETTGIPVQGIEAILMDVMNQTGRFRIVERTVLDQTLMEQDLGQSGRVSKPSAAKTGKVLGAEYLIQAVITNYEPNFKGGKLGLGGIGRMLGGKKGALLGGVGVNSKKSMVGMNFRLIDATTSEVVFTKQVESIISQSGLSLGGLGIGTGGALGGFISGYAKTPIGQAVIAGINKGVFELVKQVGTSPATGSVVKVSGDKIYLNLGAGSVSVGDNLQVISSGEELIDPETGLSLGSESTPIGTIRITEVKEKFSIGNAVDFQPQQAEAGAKVVSNKAAGSLEFSSSW